MATELLTVEAIEYIILTIIMWSVILNHGFKLYQDLYTSERKSLNHRRKRKPTITSGYKRMAFLTFASILCYGGIVISSVFSRNANIASCLYSDAFSYIFYYLSKIFMYLTFISRLHEVYGDSAYAYGKTKLFVAAVMVVLFYGFAAVFAMVTYFGLYFEIFDGDDKFPHYCYALQADEEERTITGIYLSIIEILHCLLSMITFSLPLSKVINAALEHASGAVDVTNKRFAKMIYTGTKYRVLVSFASISTLTWIILYSIGGVFLSFVPILYGLDPLINVVCLLLMTAYYPSDIYYERLCFLCMCCCDRQYRSKASQKQQEEDDQMKQNIDLSKTRQSTQSTNGDTTTQSVPISVDTDAAIKQTVEDLPSASQVDDDEEIP